MFNFEKISDESDLKEIILKHKNEIPDRSDTTVLSELIDDLAERSSWDSSKHSIVKLLGKIPKFFGEFELEDLYNLLSLIDQAEIRSDTVDLLYRAFLDKSYRSKKDLEKRAVIIKIVSMLNPASYTSQKLEEDEEKVLTKFPWLYIDILARLNWNKCVDKVSLVLENGSSYWDLDEMLVEWIDDPDIGKEKIGNAIRLWNKHLSDGGKKELIAWIKAREIHFENGNQPKITRLMLETFEKYGEKIIHQSEVELKN